VCNNVFGIISKVLSKRAITFFVAFVFKVVEEMF
jgi:hypothetical protein